MSKVKPYSLQIVEGKTKVFVPKNYKKVIETDLIVRIFLDLAIKNDCILEVLDKEATLNDDLKDENKSFMKGWYASFRNIPLFAKNLNKHFREGVTYGINLMLEGKGIDRSLFRQSSVDDVNIHLFGNSWKVKYEVEKSMIDQIKHFTRLHKAASTNIYSWSLPVEKIKEKLGIKDPTKNPMLSDNEQSYLRTVFADVIDCKIIDLESFSASYADKNNIIGCIKEYNQYLRANQKGLAPLKALVDKEIDERSNYLFKHPANKKLTKLKRPFKEIFDNVKDVQETSNAFNSSRVYTLGKEKLTIVPPVNVVDVTECKKIINDFIGRNNLNAAKASEIMAQFAPLLRVDIGD